MLDYASARARRAHDERPLRGERPGGRRPHGLLQGRHEEEGRWRRVAGGLAQARDALQGRRAAGAKPRTIAFHHDADIVCELAYDDVDKLPPGTPKTVALYNISGIARVRRRHGQAENDASCRAQGPALLHARLVRHRVALQGRGVRRGGVRSRRAAAQGRAQGRGQRDGRERDRDQRHGHRRRRRPRTTTSRRRRPPRRRRRPRPTRRRARPRPRANASDANATGAAPGKVLKKKTHKRTLTVTPSTAGLRQWAPRRSDVATLRPAGGDRRGREGAPRARGREERPRGGHLPRAQRARRPREGDRARVDEEAARGDRVDVARARGLALRGRRRARGDLQRQAHGL